jgi:hypothetical protein
MNSSICLRVFTGVGCYSRNSLVIFHSNTSAAIIVVVETNREKQTIQLDRIHAVKKRKIVHIERVRREVSQIFPVQKI